jgi:hypothetical protein
MIPEQPLNALYKKLVGFRPSYLHVFAIGFLQLDAKVGVIADENATIRCCGEATRCR